ncbi:hypothetical protein EI94DRAFT_1833798 [Lactarius quietus]|nr:hypothetical protein EI94DRAFT_1833798 [Lactarius quietus]
MLSLGSFVTQTEACRSITRRFLHRTPSALMGGSHPLCLARTPPSHEVVHSIYPKQTSITPTLSNAVVPVSRVHLPIPGKYTCDDFKPKAVVGKAFRGSHTSVQDMSSAQTFCMGRSTTDDVPALKITDVGALMRADVSKETADVTSSSWMITLSLSRRVRRRCRRSSPPPGIIVLTPEAVHQESQY